MPRRLFPVLAAATAAIVPAGASAQQERASTLPSYSLVQLSVLSAQVAPSDFSSTTKTIRSCSEAMKIAKANGWQAERKRFVHPSELPPQLRPIMRDVPNGEATPVLSEDGSALHVLVICSR
ncbi:hypothetical protein Ga0102493_111851 [Erythrobacter litoralis]|uniref:Uncharacterized protein n=1 Tax=Erythrobacter litoralis TaxID=39960 RepID=A0A074MLU0_9SPHN|nr:hypothetical protein [Erythrobacter litoralis]AOL22873.1 hypothetical protein Ga0102493_111851 [Erythrobacter litoralis]KEO92828.1 hypothetical protein EH32_13630 [Erythrobacter litoralis]